MSRADSLLWTERCKRIGIGISLSWSISRLLEAHRFFCTYGLRQFCIHNAAQRQRERKTNFMMIGFIIYGDRGEVKFITGSELGGKSACKRSCGVLYFFSACGSGEHKHMYVRPTTSTRSELRI